MGLDKLRLLKKRRQLLKNHTSRNSKSNFISVKNTVRRENKNGRNENKKTLSIKKCLNRIDFCRQLVAKKRALLRRKSSASKNKKASQKKKQKKKKERFRKHAYVKKRNDAFHKIETRSVSKFLHDLKSNPCIHNVERKNPIRTSQKECRNDRPGGKKSVRIRDSRNRIDACKFQICKKLACCRNTCNASNAKRILLPKVRKSCKKIKYTVKPPKRGSKPIKRKRRTRRSFMCRKRIKRKRVPFHRISVGKNASTKPKIKRARKYKSEFWSNYRSFFVPVVTRKMSKNFQSWQQNMSTNNNILQSISFAKSYVRTWNLTRGQSLLGSLTPLNRSVPPPCQSPFAFNHHLSSSSGEDHRQLLSLTSHPALLSIQPSVGFQRIPSTTLQVAPPSSNIGTRTENLLNSCQQLRQNFQPVPNRNHQMFDSANKMPTNRGMLQVFGKSLSKTNYSGGLEGSERNSSITIETSALTHQPSTQRNKSLFQQQSITPSCSVSAENSFLAIQTSALAHRSNLQGNESLCLKQSTMSSSFKTNFYGRSMDTNVDSFGKLETDLKVESKFMTHNCTSEGDKNELIPKMLQCIEDSSNGKVIMKKDHEDANNSIKDDNTLESCDGNFIELSSIAIIGSELDRTSTFENYNENKQPKVNDTIPHSPITHVFQTDAMECVNIVENCSDEVKNEYESNSEKTLFNCSNCETTGTMEVTYHTEEKLAQSEKKTVEFVENKIWHLPFNSRHMMSIESENLERKMGFEPNFSAINETCFQNMPAIKAKFESSSPKVEINDGSEKINSDDDGSKRDSIFGNNSFSYNQQDEEFVGNKSFCLSLGNKHARSVESEKCERRISFDENFSPIDETCFQNAPPIKTELESPSRKTSINEESEKISSVDNSLRTDFTYGANSFLFDQHTWRDANTEALSPGIVISKDTIETFEIESKKGRPSEMYGTETGVHIQKELPSHLENNRDLSRRGPKEDMFTNIFPLTTSVPSKMEYNDPVPNEVIEKSRERKPSRDVKIFHLSNKSEKKKNTSDAEKFPTSCKSNRGDSFQSFSTHLPAIRTCIFQHRPQNFSRKEYSCMTQKPSLHPKKSDRIRASYGNEVTTALTMHPKQQNASVQVDPVELDSEYMKTLDVHHIHGETVEGNTVGYQSDPFVSFSMGSNFVFSDPIYNDFSSCSISSELDTYCSSSITDDSSCHDSSKTSSLESVTSESSFRSRTDSCETFPSSSPENSNLIEINSGSLESVSTQGTFSSVDGSNGTRNAVRRFEISPRFEEVPESQTTYTPRSISEEDMPPLRISQVGEVLRYPVEEEAKQSEFAGLEPLGKRPDPPSKTNSTIFENGSLYWLRQSRDNLETTFRFNNASTRCNNVRRDLTKGVALCKQRAASEAELRKLLKPSLMPKSISQTGMEFIRGSEITNERDNCEGPTFECIPEESHSVHLIEEQKHADSPKCRTFEYVEDSAEDHQLELLSTNRILSHIGLDIDVSELPTEEKMTVSSPTRLCSNAYQRILSLCGYHS